MGLYDEYLKDDEFENEEDEFEEEEIEDEEEISQTTSNQYQNRPEIDLEDIKRLARSASPDLSEAILTFLKQPDPVPSTNPPDDALTFAKFRSELSRLRWRRKSERRKKIPALLQRFLQQTDWPPPPRFFLSNLLVELYEQGTEEGRASLIHIFQKAELLLGIWGGIKRIYKLSEEKLDAEIFGVLAWRFDMESTRYQRRDVSTGTLVYLRRRAWRFLRHLGSQLPVLYPQFAAQVLRHYEVNTQFRSTWVANHIWAHDAKPKRYSGYSFPWNYPPDDLIKGRAFSNTWKHSAAPLMLLLESCQADPPAKFAIQGLRKDFPETLRDVTPAWLDRLARRPLGSAHEFLVETLQNSPEFHQGKLKEKGLHDTVLALLSSPSQKARTYAIEYGRAHAQDMDHEQLAALLETAPSDTKNFAVQILSKRDARKLGHKFFGRLLSINEATKWAQKSLKESFERKEIPHSFLQDMIYGSHAQRQWASAYIKSEYPAKEIKAEFWKDIMDDPRHKGSNAYSATRLATTELGKFSAADIGSDWLLDALELPNLTWQANRWLQKATKLPNLDVERVKGMVFRAKYRQLALQILGNVKIVKVKELTLPWLLALARRADPSLHEFAHRYLLEHVNPSDFSEKDDKEAGVSKLFSLATGPKEPEPVRLFAQTYLRCHHPGIGPNQAETKNFGLKPKVPQSAYTAERIWSSLFDSRQDVRKFAVLITRAELRSWGYQNKIYELAESDAKEVRNLCYDAILKAGEPNADPLFTLKPKELDPDQIFAFTESRKRSTREVGMELVRRHYERLGGPERLAWLMQSPDREVRLFAVRILWEQHRPKSFPQDWKPRQISGVRNPSLEHAGRFQNVDALQNFLRQVLYGIPPGRSAESRDNTTGFRRLSASAAKRNAIEIVRDFGLQDRGFADLIHPLLQEFSGALPKGEWHACLTALTRLRNAYPDLDTKGEN